MDRSRRFWAMIITIMVVVTGLPALASAAGQPTEAPADVYTYLDDPEMIGEGQEPYHAVLRPHATEKAAVSDGNSPWVRSLDGTWRFAIADRPDEVPEGFYREGFDTAGWPAVTVPHTWQSDRLDHPVFRNIPTEVWPDDPPRAPRDINPTGAYVRRLDVPADWAGRRTFLRFESVTSGYFVWVNGHYVGYDQGGYTPAEFDVTDHVRPGANTVAVQVHRWSAGSYLEDVDQWRYSGIFRSVWAYSTPETYLRDVGITTDLDVAYRDATLNATVTLARKGDGDTSAHTVTATLVDPRGRTVQEFTGRTEMTGETATLRLSGRVANPAKWTDETPNRYTLLLSLTDPAGDRIHLTSETLGFREIEVRDKQLLVNGKRILIKGVNRAETDPDTGRHQTRQRMESDVRLMKRLNINAVRTSHYPSDPYLYDLADRHGLWVDDEVDIETHNHENCPNDCLASRPEWQKAFLDRFTAMVARDKNHPSVFLWDTGNEAGLGTAHFRMAEWATANEPTRPLYHQSNSPNGDAPYAPVWGPRYPTPAGLEAQARSTTKPIIMGEYAHAMGNSLGNFREFWEVVRRHPQVQGGFIWDWAEANLRHPLITTPDSSPNSIKTWLQGIPKVVDGHHGTALSFSGLDDFVEVYRDRRLDLTGTELTLDAWVKPQRPWTGDFTIVSKGDHQYALKMADETTLEFFIYSGGWRTVRAPVPADWYDTWHRVTGTYDGSALRLYVDGEQAGQLPFAGAINWSSWDVNVARNSETMQDDLHGRMAHGTIDEVRIYPRPLTAGELAAGADPKDDAALALDFDSFTERGSFLSNGESLSGVDGLIGSDRFVQPENAQLAWVHSPIRITRSGDTGTVRVASERAFAGTDDLELRWRLTEGRRTLRSGRLPLSLAPGGSTEVSLPELPDNPSGAERWLTVRAVLAEPAWHAARGHVVGFGQFAVGGPFVPGMRLAEPRAAMVEVAETADAVVVSGRDFRYTFSREQGTLTSMRHQGTELVRTGPELDVWRPPISNETYTWGNAEGENWRAAGLDRLATAPDSVTVTPPGSAGERATVTITGRVAAPGHAAPPGGAWFDQTMTYAVDSSGQIEMRHKVSPQGDARRLPYLGRLGYTVKVPDRFDGFTWYGRGPVENYNDRKDGTLMGVWSSTVDEQYVDYYRPQDYGNHDDVRWAMLTDGRTGGLLVGGDIEASVTPYDDLDRALYPFARQRNAGWHTLHVDHGVSGVGDTPNPVRPEYQVRADRDYSYTTLLRPVSAAEARAGAPAGPSCGVTVSATGSAGLVPPGGTTTVTAELRNTCQEAVDQVTVRPAPATGWTMTPDSADLGRLSGGAVRTVEFTAGRGEDTPHGQQPFAVEVTANLPDGDRFRAADDVTLTAAPPVPRGEARVSSLPLLAEENGWGPLERDTSNGEAAAGDGRPITIDGTVYETGLGVHALSVVDIYLGGACERFTSSVGVDDETGNGGSVVFEVYTDGEQRHVSPVLRGSGAAAEVDVDVTDAETLRLRVTDAGDGNGLDHADWAAAMLTCSA